MKSKKNYASPEIDIIKLSFENILADDDVKWSRPGNYRQYGDSVDDPEFYNQ